jgi:hypothetical protein
MLAPMLGTTKEGKPPLAIVAFLVLFYALLACFFAFLLRDLKIYVAVAVALFLMALPFVGTRRFREMRAKREWVLVFCGAILLRVLNVRIPFAALGIGAAIFFASLLAITIYLAIGLQRSKRGLPQRPGQKIE